MRQRRSEQHVESYLAKDCGQTFQDLFENRNVEPKSKGCYKSDRLDLLKISSFFIKNDKNCSPISDLSVTYKLMQKMLLVGNSLQSFFWRNTWIIRSLSKKHMQNRLLRNMF